MQRAAFADTIGTPRLSGDNSTENSIWAVLLTEEQSHAMLDQANCGHDSVGAVRTLLQAASEVCEEVADPKGFYYRDTTYVKRRMDHLFNLIHLAGEKIDVIDKMIEREYRILSEGRRA